jgi:hypothetical protein
MQKGLSSCMVISATKPQQEVRESYATVYHRWTNMKRDRNGIVFDVTKNLWRNVSTGIGMAG